ncbi:hypothetical protein BpHYR1_016295 [Brachionus plicatilis]|uniref:Uncharacterized protein n=1 Tax=Brachionus plicatilis TaxID=10195 RepID=A0A3M7QRQ9_BRAPC|nr:hypothetical protein BpHYR1_016295 [Brachionus plicatilis]
MSPLFELHCKVYSKLSLHFFPKLHTPKVLDLLDFHQNLQVEAIFELHQKSLGSFVHIFLLETLNSKERQYLLHQLDKTRDKKGRKISPSFLNNFIIVFNYCLHLKNKAGILFELDISTKASFFNLDKKIIKITVTENISKKGLENNQINLALMPKYTQASSDYILIDDLLI